MTRSVHPGAEAALGSDRRDTLDRLASLRRGHTDVVAASEGSNADDEHDPEGSTIAYERSQLGALIAQAERHLAEIDAALGRVRDGSYGRCVVGGEAIPAARLEARPTALTCIAHAGSA
ncbi:MAG: transcriptional regulator, TraR/DksA family [Humibacillus sp.]|nr:transcriptional regulator, TraR/DksA family [Humibacillus sp.]